MSLTVTGDEQLAAAMTRIGDGLGHLDVAAKAAAELLQLDARGRAPKRTGTLASSVVGRATGGTATVGTPVRYGLPVHFGVPSRGMRAQPFLADAVRAGSSDIAAAYTKNVQAIIDREI